jgi:hypothetical protein
VKAIIYRVCQDNKSAEFIVMADIRIIYREVPNVRQEELFWAVHLLVAIATEVAAVRIGCIDSTASEAVLEHRRTARLHFYSRLQQFDRL